MRSANMVVLTGEIKEQWPGVVVYGIGDDDHKRSPSGHNEDDTPGSRPEQEDPDNKPEHRAIDVMIGRSFTSADAWALIAVMLAYHKHRLLYIIYAGWIWSAKRGWKQERYTGRNKHFDHVHLSGTWRDDENIAPWFPKERPARKRRTSMMLYHKAGTKVYALAGSSPGTEANWIETEDYDGLAVPWAVRIGDAITLSPDTWDMFKRQFLSPLEVIDR